MLSEKEYNGYLFDQLELLERIEMVAKEGDRQKLLDQIALERKFIERKLYQDLSLPERR